MKIPIHKDNWEKGRRRHKIEGVVIHIMQGSLSGTDSHFGTPSVYVSAHLGIGKDGTVHKYVPIGDTAYHAGRMNMPTWEHIKKTLWGTRINPNYYTYGIECEGYRGDRWTEKQMQAIVQQISHIIGLKHTRDRIISHHEIAIDKENMSEWCDEVVKRLNSPVSQPPDRIERAVKLLEEAIKLLS